MSSLSAFEGELAFGDVGFLGEAPEDEILARLVEGAGYGEPSGFEAEDRFLFPYFSIPNLGGWVSPKKRAGQSLRGKIVRVAEQEWERWGRGTLHETSRRGVSILEQYYRTGVGERSGDRLSDPQWHSSHPWSAVFISWVLRQAGAGDRFRYSRGHHYYIAAAKRNRMAQRTSNPFWACRITEVAPKPGDLVCNQRAGSGATYTNIHDTSTFRSTHSDIVTAVHPNKIVVVGGNTSQSYPKRGLGANTVGKKIVRTDDRGFIVQRRSNPFFAVIKVRDGRPAAGSVSPVAGRGSPAQRMRAALQRGLWSTAVRLAIMAGQRDANRLTDLIFFARHPERKGRRIKRHEKELAREWLAIRSRLVMPLLHRSANLV